METETEANSCTYCTQPHTKLCDYRLEHGTCDRPLCDEHATIVGTMHINRGRSLLSGFTTIDYCPEHQALLVKGA